MAQLQPEAEPWDRNATRLRLLLRLIGITAGGYVLVSAGVFRAAAWVTVLTMLALGAMYALALLRRRPFERLAIALTTAMMVLGAVTAPYLNFVPLFLVVSGGIILVGQPRLRLRTAVVLTAAAALVLVVASYVATHSWLTVLASLLGAVVIALIGANRRQSRQREAQDRELVTRSIELQQRSSDLIAQTERAQHETARAAALEERSRIARDIHDVLAHSLGGLVVQLDAVEALLTEGADPAAAAHRLRASRQLAVDGLREAKKAVNELRAPDQEGAVDLVAELEVLLAGPVATQLNLGMDVAGEPYPVPARVASAFTAVCREALTNLNKHAPVGPRTLSVLFEPATVAVELVNAAPTSGRASLSGTGLGMGLPGMRARMAEVGGSLTAGPDGSCWVVRAEWGRP
jgi:signal transduction histidine kinase